PETCPAFDSHAYQFSRTVMYGNEARVVEHLFVLIASDVNMNVRNDANAKAFVQRVETPVWLRTRNLLRSHNAHRFAVPTKNIETAVKMIAAVSRVKTAAHFTHCSDNLMRTLL